MTFYIDVWLVWVLTGGSVIKFCQLWDSCTCCLYKAKDCKNCSAASLKNSLHAHMSSTMLNKAEDTNTGSNAGKKTLWQHGNTVERLINHTEIKKKNGELRSFVSFEILGWEKSVCQMWSSFSEREKIIIKNGEDVVDIIHEDEFLVRINVYSFAPQRQSAL